MGQEVTDGVDSPLFQILVRTGAEEQTPNGLRGKASHCVRGDSSSRPPIQHPLRHEAIGGIEDHEGSSIKGSEDVFDQTLVAATMFPNGVPKVCRSFDDGHAIAGSVPFCQCPGTEPRMDRI